MTIRRTGFFAELGGDDERTSLQGAERGALPDDVRGVVADYLDAGGVVIATSERADDVLRPERRDVCGRSILTDGSYVWPQELGYYVREYGIEVPADLVERAAHGTPPTLSDDALLDIALEFAPPP